MKRLGAVLLAAFALAACGGGDDEPEVGDPVEQLLLDDCIATCSWFVECWGKESDCEKMCPHWIATGANSGLGLGDCLKSVSCEEAEEWPGEGVCGHCSDQYPTDC